MGNGGEIVGFCGAVCRFIVVDINCRSISIYPPPGEISRVSRDMVELDGYGFGGAVVGVVGDDDMRWWTLYWKERNDGMFAWNN